MFGEVDLCVEGFEVGGDDYLIKFFVFVELFVCVNVFGCWCDGLVFGDGVSKFIEFCYGDFSFDFLVCICEW